MLGVRHRPATTFCAALALATLLSCCCSALYGQSSTRGGGAPTPRRGGDDRTPPDPRLRGPQFRPVGPQILVQEVRIVGNRTVKADKVYSYLKTRKDRLFDPEVVQADVRALSLSGLFRDVRTFTQQRDDGVVVTFEVVELPTIQYIKFVGNRALTTKSLKRQSGLKEGEALNFYNIDQARQKIVELYRTKGYPNTEVEIVEGARSEDLGVVMRIEEGRLQRILHVEFEGNTIASDGRLKTRIASKPGFLWYLFKGKVNRDKIDEDVDRLISYYRSLGYFNAKIGRELLFSPSGKWLTLKFIINEGPQYVVRNVSIVGNKKFDTAALHQQMQLSSGEFFNAAKMSRDINTLKDIYGSQGHVYADIKADPRFLEEPGKLDLVYDIEEGAVYRVGRINVHIAGEYSHTRRNVVLNRISLRPGDIIDIRKVRNSERRLKASQLFVNEPAKGVVPRIVVQPAEIKRAVESLAEGEGRDARGTRYRGQSPERDAAATRIVDIDVFLPAWTGR